jgi:uncharacterized membrane protein
MSTPEPKAARPIDSVIALLLRVGVVVSALVLLTGGTIYLIRHGTEPKPDLSHFVPEPPRYSHPRAIFEAAREGQGRAIVQVGLLLLIATPVLRVLFTLVAFAIRRDLLYVVLAAVVLALLAVGFSGVVSGR